MRASASRVAIAEDAGMHDRDVEPAGLRDEAALRRDGRPELVLWESFPLSVDASAADYGLVAWIYEYDLGNYLALDWRASRDMARDIAAAYRLPLTDATIATQEQRTRAADLLDDFAAGRCESRADPHR